MRDNFLVLGVDKIAMLFDEAISIRFYFGHGVVGLLKEDFVLVW